MAELLGQALNSAGYRVDVISHLRTRAQSPEPERLSLLREQANAEIARIRQGWRAGGGPAALFTYHSYYKSPDLIGPALAAAFDLPYLVAEASLAGKRRDGPWAGWEAEATAAARAADRHFCFTRRDADGLIQAGIAAARLTELPPFIDTSPFEALSRHDVESAPALAAIGMMRGGRKSRSFAALAAALCRLPDLPWRLTIAGDGPDRAGIETHFAALPAGRVHFAGRLTQPDLRDLLASTDIYTFPGIGEAYGLAYLEAQAAGLPVIAFDSGGVGATLIPGETGLITNEGDIEAYAMAIRSLILDRAKRMRMGAAARRFVLEQRGVNRAAEKLRSGIEAAFAGKSA